ncbi:MAG: hypothetical protein HUK20_06575 [Fibrobacter sp.]|nr:hypothetical protein [Fibrobacter sp.]
MKFGFLNVYRALVFVGILTPLFAGLACAEKSVWQKFKDFFTPGETLECEGTSCDEYHKIDSKINTLEGKYSRERRPIHKRRYKQELDSLCVIRDSLVAVIKGAQGDSKVARGDSLGGVSSAAKMVGESSSSVGAKSLPDACRTDTVYVRDTVIVRDTLYVVVTDKPAHLATPPALSPASDPAGTALDTPSAAPTADSSTAK